MSGPFMSGPKSTTIHLVGQGELGESLRALVSLAAPLAHLRHHHEGELLILTARVAGELSSEQQVKLEAWAKGRGLALALATALDPAPPASISVTLLGTEGLGRAVLIIATLLEGLDLRIHETRPIGDRVTHGVEVLLGSAKGAGVSDEVFTDVRRRVLEASRELDADVAVQRNDFFRKNRRLVCLDVDSTFVQGEFIDELAALAGVKTQVAEITSRAMRGELDFQAALRERVSLLQGLPMADALNLCERFVLSPGAEDLVMSLRRLGVRVGLVSGGFDFFVERLRARFGLDFAFANQLEVQDDVLTGKLLGAIVDGQRKAQVLRDMANVFSIDLRQTVAVGDGANDIFMLEAAGLGIAYQAKPRLLAHADACFRHHDRLDTMLYLMGFDPPEVKDACQPR